jgi:ferredoxin
MKVSIEKGKCIGSGNCSEIAPNYFRQSSVDGTSTLLRYEVGSGDEGDVRFAASICPVSAIKIRE